MAEEKAPKVSVFTTKQLIEFLQDSASHLAVLLFILISCSLKVFI